MNKPLILKSILLIAAFIAMYCGAGKYVFAFVQELLPENSYVQAVVAKLIYYSPVLIVSGSLFLKELPKLLGLKHSVSKSFGLAMLFVLPMFLLFPFYFEFNTEPDVFYVFESSLLAAFFEELAFRALVFGALYVVCQWRFFPAVLLSAIVFGLGHLYQASDITGAVSTFAVTFAGAVWFSWLYVKWEKNLYIPIFLHFLMNFSWHLFEVSSGAAGGAVANIARLLTILISIIITVRYAGGQGVFSWKNIRVQAPAKRAVAG